MSFPRFASCGYRTGAMGKLVLGADVEGCGSCSDTGFGGLRYDVHQG